MASAATTQFDGRQSVVDALNSVAAGQHADAARSQISSRLSTISPLLYRGEETAAVEVRRHVAEIEQLLSALPRADAIRLSETLAGYRKAVESVIAQSAQIATSEPGWEPLGDSLQPPLDRLMKSRAESADADGAMEMAQAMTLVGDGRRLAATFIRDANAADSASLPALRAQGEAMTKKWAEVATKVQRLQRNYGSGTGAAAMKELAPAVERAIELLGALVPAKIERAALRATAVDSNAAKLDEAMAELARASAANVDRAAGSLPDALERGAWIIVAVGVAGLLIGLVLIILLIRSIAPPIRRLTDAMTTLAGKDLSVAVPGVERSDELGQMAKAVLVFKEGLAEAERFEAEQKEAADAARKKFMTEAIDYLTDETGDVVHAVSSAAEDVQSQASSVSEAVQRTNVQAASVSAAADQATQNVEIVAAAAQELSASISEIAQQVGRSMTVAEQAVTEADRTSRTIDALRDAVGKIGAVVGLINQIASQTNLLALNATIEAARAGDAGKGFSVVASEVKQLAQQTARATEEIQSQVDAVRSQTTGAVEAITGIGATIRDLNALAASVAAAVEQQGAATKEIAQNVEQAALGMATVSDTIQDVVQLALSTGGAAESMLASAEGLGAQSGRLSQSIDAFVGRLKRSA